MRRGVLRVGERAEKRRERVVDNIQNKVIIFSIKTISKKNTFLIELVAIPNEKGRTNCANT